MSEGRRQDLVDADIKLVADAITRLRDTDANVAPASLKNPPEVIRPPKTMSLAALILPHEGTNQRISVRKQRKADKTILTKTQREKLIQEIKRCKTVNGHCQQIPWSRLAKLSLFNGFDRHTLRHRGLQAWKEYEQDKKRFEMIKAKKLGELQLYRKQLTDLASEKGRAEAVKDLQDLIEVALVGVNKSIST
jgi:hypothetical protein